MKWGRSHEIVGPERLLYQVLTWVLWIPGQLDESLRKIFITDGGFGGDPGWEMEHVLAEQGPGTYRVWANPEVSGIEPPERIYTAKEVYEALHETLRAFGEEYPGRIREVEEALEIYRLPNNGN